MKKTIFRLISLILALTVVFSVAVPSFATAGRYSKTAKEERRLRVSEQIVEIAKNEIGFYESDINKFTKWYFGRDNATSWCCIFVSWCAAQAGVIDTAIPQRAACSSMKNWFDLRGKYYSVDSDYVPRKGDIVFYNTAVDGTDDIHHVEIVTEDGFITKGDVVGVKSIGGNTSNQYYSGCQYVMEKFRPVDGPRAQIVGYCHPAYEKSEGLAAKYHTFSDDIRNDDMRYIHSKYISAIYHIECFWNRIVQFFTDAKLEVENWFIRVFTGKSDDEDIPEEPETTQPLPEEVTEPVEEEVTEIIIEETTIAETTEVTEEPVKEKSSWFKNIFKRKDSEEETTTEISETTEVTEITEQLAS